MKKENRNRDLTTKMLQSRIDRDCWRALHEMSSYQQKPISSILESLISKEYAKGGDCAEDRHVFMYAKNGLHCINCGKSYIKTFPPKKWMFDEKEVPK